MWQPMTWGKKMDESWDVCKLTFGGGRLEVRDAAGNMTDQSVDLEVGGIPELHKECTAYLDEYDRVCADYLAQIMVKLPMTMGNVEYRKASPWEAGELSRSASL
jgi:hypothetical protein